MATARILGRCAIRLNNISKGNGIRLARLSTSSKNKDTVISPLITTNAEEEPVPKPKNWISWGFNFDSEEADNTHMHMMFFGMVTMCLVGGSFIWSYTPDHRMLNWAQREGFLELRRREAEGLPLIDPELVDISTFELPTDEDLGEIDIII